MKLVQEKTALNQFTAYGADWVSVNGEKHCCSLLVTHDAVQTWRPTGFDDLQREDFAAVLACQPSVVLLGTGRTICFPHPGLLVDLINAGIGVEVMDNGAVFRTFNALVGEGRKVVALVLFD